MATVNARRLGWLLRSDREAIGLSQLDVSNETGISQTTLVKYENGGGVGSARVLRELCDLYQVTEERRRLLESLRLRGKEKGWWAAEPWSGLVSPAHELQCSYELESHRILRYSPNMIYGLFQTREYATAVTGGPLSDPATLQDRIEFRLARWNAVRNRVTPPDIVTVIDESALLRPFGGPVAMHGQLSHMLHLPEWVDVRIIPLNNPSITGGIGFALFEIDGEVTASEDSSIAAIYYERADQIESAQATFNHLLKCAHSATDSRQLISSTMERHYHA
ncbi:helix-turn-helix domain-containing protein [Longispora urticae]